LGELKRSPNRNKGLLLREQRVEREWERTKEKRGREGLEGEERGGEELLRLNRIASCLSPAMALVNGAKKLVHQVTIAV